MMTREQFVERVERHLESTGTKPSVFGKEALGDPSFVNDLRNGRSPRLDSVAKVLTFIEQRESAAA